MKLTAIALLFLIMTSGCKKDDPEPSSTPKPMVKFTFGYGPGIVYGPDGRTVAFIGSDTNTTVIKTKWSKFFVVEAMSSITYECFYTKKISGVTKVQRNTIYPK